MRAPPKFLLWAPGLCALIHGCSVGPDHTPPDLHAPASWSRSGESAGEGAGPESAREAPVSRALAVPLAEWWRGFGDSTLDGLVARAREANHDLRGAMARLRETRALVGIAASAGLPGIQAQGRYNRSRRSENLGDSGSFLGGGGAGGGGFGPGGKEEDFWQAGFDASWEIDIFGGVRRKVEAAEADVEAAEETVRDALVSLTAEVVRTYLELRSAQRASDVLARNLAGQEDTVRLTRSRFEAGLVGELDAVRAEAQSAATAAEVPAARLREEQALHRLGVLLGLEPRALAAELASRPGLPGHVPELPTGLPSDLLLRRPDLRRAEAELHAACARIGVARADYFPRLVLNGSIGFESERLRSLTSWDSRYWSLGPSVTWPIFASGRISANVEAQDARHEAALIAYEAQLLVAFEEVETSLAAHSLDRERLERLRSSVAASRRAHAMADELYQSGLIDFLSVLEAERSLHQAEALEVEGERAAVLSLVSLAKALGGGWEPPGPVVSPVRSGGG